jgi:hypothetical protein
LHLQFFDARPRNRTIDRIAELLDEGFKDGVIVLSLTSAQARSASLV